jgi:Pectinacetylesterase
MITARRMRLALGALALFTSLGSSTRAGAQAPRTGTPVQVDDWTWIPLLDSVCRDGTATGIGVRTKLPDGRPRRTDKLLVFVKGGGACLDEASCLANTRKYDLATFTGEARGTLLTGKRFSDGVLDEDLTQNPVGDYTQIVVPYCSGDFHAGNTPAPVQVPYSALKPQHFKGALNMKLALSYVVAAFAEGLRRTGAHVIFQGESAGSAGVGLSLPVLMAKLAEVGSGARVTLVNDSDGLNRMPDCLLAYTRALWSLDRGAYGAFPAASDFAAFDVEMLRRHPRVERVLVAAENDFVSSYATYLSTLAGTLLGQSLGCSVVPPRASAHAALLLGLRARFASARARDGVRSATYFVEGSTTHQWGTFSRFYGTVQHGLAMSDWYENAVLHGLFEDEGLCGGACPAQ